MTSRVFKSNQRVIIQETGDIATFIRIEHFNGGSNIVIKRDGQQSHSRIAIGFDCDESDYLSPLHK